MLIVEMNLVKHLPTKRVWMVLQKRQGLFRWIFFSLIYINAYRVLRSMKYPILKGFKSHYFPWI